MSRRCPVLPGEESWDTSLIVGGGGKLEQRPETLRECRFGGGGLVRVAGMKAAMEWVAGADHGPPGVALCQQPVLRVMLSVDVSL